MRHFYDPIGEVFRWEKFEMEWPYYSFKIEGVWDIKSKELEIEGFPLESGKPGHMVLFLTRSMLILIKMDMFSKEY